MSKDKLIPKLRFPEFEKDGEWSEKILGDIADSESSSLALNKIELREEGYSVYGADSVVGYIDEYHQEDKYISIVKDGSGVGRLNLCEPKSSILGTLAYIKSKDKKEYFLDWIYYLMNTINFISYKKGSGIPHIYYSDFKIEPVGVPKPEEQQKIASCLSSLDDLIAAHNDKLDALKDHKKGLLQNLFPQEGETVPRVRFPEFEDDGEWDSDSLVNLAQFRRGSFPQPYGLPEWYDDEDGMPFIQVYDVDDNFRLKPSTKRKISELAAEQSVFIEKGTVIITIQGSIGRVAITQYDAYIDRTLLIFQEFYDEIDKAFFAYTLFLLFEIEKQKAPGGIIKTITKQVLSDFTIKMPSLEEQKKIASCLAAVDELINAQSDKIEELNQHKRGLMQGLFPNPSANSGETIES